MALVPIDFHYVDKNIQWELKLVSKILQTIFFCVPQNKDSQDCNDIMLSK